LGLNEQKEAHDFAKKAKSSPLLTEIPRLDSTYYQSFGLLYLCHEQPTFSAVACEVQVNSHYANA